MADIKHLINGQDFGEPRNWEELEITIDWLATKDYGTINVTDLEFVLEANEYLQQRILDGLSGGVGIFEGEPYQILVGDESDPEFIFDGYLDFTEGTSFIGGEEFVCSLKKVNSEDWLNDVADGFSHAYLFDLGVISTSDFKKVPYVINYIPDNMQLIVLSMSIFMMTKELIENVQSLADTAADVTDASTPVLGYGAGASAAGPVVTATTAWDLGNFILVVVKGIAQLAYTVAIGVAIVNLIDELLQQILPAQRDHLGMDFRTIMEKSCGHLGLTFVSDIDDLSWVYVPEKDYKGGDSGETGFPTSDGPLGTFGDTIRVLKQMFNADYVIQDGNFIFNRRDSFEVKSEYVMPSFFNNQERLLDNFYFNTDEIISNYNIFYQFDTQDQNTLDVNTGRVFQAVTEPVSKINSDMVSIKNLSQISLPFSMGLRKEELNDVEEVAKELAKVVDGLTGVFGNGTNYENSIKDRKGSLLMSSHFLSVGKIVVMSGSKLAANQRETISSLNLWDKYHFINSFADYNGEHNQYFRYKEQRVPMTIEEFSSIMETNKATDSNGNEYEIEKCVYNPYTTSALLDFRVKKKYTNNLKITIVT